MTVEYLKGLRAIRYFKEIPGVDYVIANDINADAVAAIKRNVEYNGLTTEQIRVNHEDAKYFFSSILFFLSLQSISRVSERTIFYIDAAFYSLL
jgi:tRNA G26 N,N-dimethylase Trm1